MGLFVCLCQGQRSKNICMKTSEKPVSHISMPTKSDDSSWVGQKNIDESSLKGQKNINIESQNTLWKPANHVSSHSETGQSRKFSLGNRPIRYFLSRNSADQVTFVVGVQSLWVFHADSSTNEVILAWELSQSGFFGPGVQPIRFFDLASQLIRWFWDCHSAN